MDRILCPSQDVVGIKRKWDDASEHSPHMETASYNSYQVRSWCEALVLSSKNFTWINSFHLYHNTVRYCEIPVALLVPSLLNEATKIPAQDHSARNWKPSDTSQIVWLLPSLHCSDRPCAPKRRCHTTKCNVLKPVSVGVDGGVLLALTSDQRLISKLVPGPRLLLMFVWSHW